MLPTIAVVMPMIEDHSRSLDATSPAVFTMKEALSIDHSVMALLGRADKCILTGAETCVSPLKSLYWNLLQLEVQ